MKQSSEGLGTLEGYSGCVVHLHREDRPNRSWGVGLAALCPQHSDHKLLRVQLLCKQPDQA